MRRGLSGLCSLRLGHVDAGVPGIAVARDVRDGSTKQGASAIEEGLAPSKPSETCGSASAPVEAVTINRAWRRTRRPQGQPTRGKTAANRLRRVDHFLLLYDAPLIRRNDGAYAGAFFVDLGYGAEPSTTLESAVRLRRANPQLRVLGVEIDPARVGAAQLYSDSTTCFRLGGFNLPLVAAQDERVRVVRAFNVLRQYDEGAVAAAYAELAHYILPGGLLIEGTSDPHGRLWVANVLRRQAAATWAAEALVFSTNFRPPFAPADFQAVLPKNYIHRMSPGEPIHALLEMWKAAAQRTSSERVWGERRWFLAAARALRASGARVDIRRRWLGRGYLVVSVPFFADV